MKVQILLGDPHPTIPLQTAAIPTTLPLTQPAATVSKQPTGVATPKPTATATEDGFSVTQIYPQLALLCGESGSYSAICTFDTQANMLEIIAQPTESFSYGRPFVVRR
ncbi:MAG: hypothetical protein M5U34_18240 [Chloroflexi bacterium]|nr:hypothetical protein [Chloroflexota bacterium]